MKRIKYRFKKDTNKTYFPFLLNDLQPWQNQVSQQMDKLNEQFILPKTAYIGFEIINGSASITFNK